MGSIKITILAINILIFLSFKSTNGMAGMGGLCRIDLWTHIEAGDFEKLMNHFIISAKYCQLEMNPGKKEIGCTGNNTVRWYFDVKSEECLKFNYSGCEGNENNFDSLLKCKDRCMPTLKPADMHGLTEQFKVYKMNQKKTV
jgi:hypothetical protein